MKGIIDQMKDSHPNYNLTKEKIEEIIKDVMYTKDTSKPKTIKERTCRELPLGFDLDFQIQDGYMYQTSGDMVLMTGSGGIRSIITSMREAGFPDSLIAQDIFVGDYSKGSDGRMYWIGDVKWTPITKD